MISKSNEHAARAQFEVTSMISEQIARHEVQSPINCIHFEITFLGKDFVCLFAIDHFDIELRKGTSRSRWLLYNFPLCNWLSLIKRVRLQGFLISADFENDFTRKNNGNTAYVADIIRIYTHR